MITINEKVHSLNDRIQWEFKSIEKFLIGKGIDVGCGTNRLSPEVLSVDEQPDKRYAHADVVHDCKDLDISDKVVHGGEEYFFHDNELDFIFSSHCLEDFEDIPTVFQNWWRKLKVNGLMILLLPDMESENPCPPKNSKVKTRYPTVEDLQKHNEGNPAHRTNVGKRYIETMLEKIGVSYEMLQCDTLPHDKTCSIDFVIKKTKE